MRRGGRARRARSAERCRCDGSTGARCALRELCLLTRAGLAMRAAIGGGGPAIAAIERGVADPDAETVAAIARALGVEADELAANEVDEG